MARSTADFASTTSMIEARLRVRTASTAGEDPEAAFILFSTIPRGGLSIWVWGERGGEGGESSMTVLE